MFDCNSPLISIFCLPGVRARWLIFLYIRCTIWKQSLTRKLPASKTLATNDEASEEPVIDHSKNVEKKKF